MSLQPGKYQSPIVVSHTVRDSAKGNPGVHIVFLVDPGDGCAPEEIACDLWLMMNANSEFNDKALKSLAVLGADLSVGLKPLLLGLMNDQPPKLSGIRAELDLKMETGKEILDEDGRQKLDPKTGQPQFYPDRLKVAWINEIGAAPVEAMENERLDEFVSDYDKLFTASLAKLGSKAKARKPTAEQVAAAQANAQAPRPAAAPKPAPQPSSPVPSNPSPSSPVAPSTAGATEDVF